MFGKTIDLALCLTCMLWWDIGVVCHLAPCHAIPLREVRPDSLYRESFHCWERNLRNKELKLIGLYETLTPPFIQHACLYDCILSLCYLIKFLVESSAIIYLSHNQNKQLVTTIHGQDFIIIPPSKGDITIRNRVRLPVLK